MYLFHFTLNKYNNSNLLKLKRNDFKPFKLLFLLSKITIKVTYNSFKTSLNNFGFIIRNLTCLTTWYMKLCKISILKL